MKGAFYGTAWLTLLLGGCSADSRRTDEVNLPAPVVTLSESDDSHEVELSHGDAFLIRLKGDSDKDSFWGLRKAPDTVEFLTENKGDSDNNFEFLFRVLKSGPLTLTFAKFHEDQDRVEKRKEYKVTLKVR